VTITKGTPSPSPSPGASGPVGVTPLTAEQQGANAFGNSGATTATGRVWMPGAQTISPNAPQSAQQFGAGSWVSQAEAEAAYFTWDQKKRDDFRAKALVGGLLKYGDGDMEASALWKNLADQASNYGANGQPVSPMDLMASYVKANTNGSQWVRQGDFEVNQLTGEKKYVGPQFKTTTASRIDMTDPTTARAISNQLFQQLLGRDPNQGEIAAYAQALSQSEIQNPSQQTTTTQYDMTTGDPTNTSTVSTGGMTADAQAQLAADQIKKKPEYGQVQAVTTYQNAFDSAVYGSQG
jgi:hypothetical protein